MITPLKRRQTSDEDYYSTFSTLINQKHPPLSALPEIVSQCLDNLTKTSEKIIGKLRINTFKVVREWGHSAELIRDKGTIFTIHEQCIRILLELQPSSAVIAIDVSDGKTELTDIEFELLRFVFPSFSTDVKLMTKGAIQALVNFLNDLPCCVRDLIDLHKSMQKLEIRYVKNKIYSLIKQRMKAPISWDDLLCLHSHFENHPVQQFCLRTIASLLMKSTTDQYPFIRSAEGYVNRNALNLVVKKETNLFYLIQGFEGLIKHQYDMASDAIDRLKSQNHDSIAFTILLAQFCIHLHAFNEALPLLSDAVDSDPDDLGIRKTRLDVAIEAENYEIILADSSFVLATDNSLNVLRCYRALALYHYDRKQEAWEIIHSVLKEAAQIDCAYYIRARFYFIENRFDQALADVQLLLSKDAENLKALQLAVMIYYSIANSKETIRAATALLLKTPNDLTARRIRSRAFILDGQLQSALVDCNHILQKVAQDIDALLDRAHVYKALNNHVMAQNDLLKVLEQAPDHAEALELMATLNLIEELPMIAPSA